MPDPDPSPHWRVGALSTATGLTVRTLHHYNQIGLLTPAGRSGGGHRLYSADDVRRLMIIVILRRAGLGLAEIKRVLDRDEVDVAALIERQTKDLESALIDTVAFGRRLREAPIEELSRDPTRVRELINWVQPNPITAQPVVFLVYADVELAHRTLIEMFGFGPGVIARGDDGSVGYAELSGPIGNIRLHGPRPGLSAPDPAAEPSAMTVVGVADVAAHFDRAVRAGATIERPLRTLFGAREYLAFDHEHHLWCFQQELPAGP
ncbi:MerR family transcriptional regulator [Microlunatus speluncae]|uniref:MerR family transcriptional regulator n=1 Tax=Microlunatus speluncae TaxID=2594267 RepID=UPI0012667FDF|nr:MerR family transcriptional regulator [Microlunatus speluncae]